ncbi:MAG TPA: MarR family transcriptional regulator [Terriglobales bacterium]|nr:MarR family transcriptional regulator [Terriglobales bacterium]
MLDLDEAERNLRADAQEIVANLRTLRRLVLRTAADIGRSGLTGPQISVQMLLVVNGPMTVGDLGRDLGLCHSTVSGIVDRLEARGLVQRTPDPADRRCTRIANSPAVQRYVQDLADSPEAPASRLVEALRGATPQERRKVTEGLSLLRQLLDRRRH